MKEGDIVVYNGSRFLQLYGDGYYYVLEVYDPHGVVSLIRIGPTPGETITLEKSDLDVVGNIGRELSTLEKLRIMAGLSIPDELMSLFEDWTGKRQV